METTKPIQRLQRTGIVTSNRMQKTIVVELMRDTVHPEYKKVIKKYRRIKVHDEKNDAKVGDRVLIEQTRPLSKDKRWRLVKIVEQLSTQLGQADNLEQVS